MKHNSIFIVGAPKCGTTALYDALAGSDKVCGAVPKEPTFFEIYDEWKKGSDYYLQEHFPQFEQGQFLLDARPAHLLLPYASQRIYEFFPKAKIIAICRNPIERAHSHWWMRFSRGRERLSFNEAIAQNMDHPDIDCVSAEILEKRWRDALTRDSGWVDLRVYLEMGYYGSQVERYINRFGREHVHIIILEELIANPEEEMHRVWAFLGIPYESRGPYGNKLPKANEAMTSTAALVNRLPGRKHAGMLMPKPWRERLKRDLSRLGRSPKLDLSCVPAGLFHIYKEESVKLARIMNRSTPPWILK